MPAKSACRPIRSSGRGSRAPTSSCSSAAACRRRPRRVIRCSTFPTPRQTARPRPRRRAARSAGTIIRLWGSSRRRRNSAPRSKASIRRRRSRGRRRRVRRAPTTSPGASRRRPIPAAVQMSEIMFALRRRVPRRDLHDRGRQLRHLGRTLPALPPDRAAARADLRLDGLRPAGGDRRGSRSFRTGRSSASPATATS